jgi:putative MATE family efflux protein
MEAKKRVEIFENMPVSRALLLLAIPTIMNQLASIIYNLMDTYFIGQTGDTLMMAAVSITGPALYVVIAVACIFSYGGSSLLARSLGVKNFARAKQTSAFCIFGGILCSLIVIIPFALFIDPTCRLLGASVRSMPYARVYFVWTVIICAVPQSLQSIFGNLVRAEGGAKYEMGCMLVGYIVHLALIPLFLYKFKWGIMGLGLSNFLTFVLVDALYVLYLYLNRRETMITISPKHLKWDGEMAKAILVVGSPMALRVILNGFATSLLNKTLSVYGDTAVAAAGIVKKLDNVAKAVGEGLAYGVVPLVAYNYAAKNYKRMEEFITFTIKAAFVVCGGLLLLFLTQAQAIVSLLVNNTETAKLGAHFLRIFCLAGPFVGIGATFNNAFQAMGKGVQPLMMSLTRQGLVLIPLMFLLQTLMGMDGIIWAQTASSAAYAILSGLLFVIFLRKLRKGRVVDKQEALLRCEAD